MFQNIGMLQQALIVSGYDSKGMDYTESAAYYSSSTFTTSWTAITVCGVFETTDSICDFVDYMGGIFDYLCRVSVDSGYVRINSANGVLRSTGSSYDDGNPHSFWFQYTNGGAFEFKVDGADADDTGWGSRVVPTSSMKTGSNTTLEHGRRRVSGGTGNFTGRLGFIGITNSVAPNHDDFFDSNGRPFELDETGWTEWNSTQPAWWSATGEMDSNDGSETATMNKNGAGFSGPTSFGWS